MDDSTIGQAELDQVDSIIFHSENGDGIELEALSDGGMHISWDEHGVLKVELDPEIVERGDKP